MSVRILAIESSCDETAAALVEDGRRVLSNIISSQVDIHAVYGGVVPEIASRKHIENIVPCVDAALKGAGITLADVDAIAVTNGPGLVGALLVGVSYAKGLAFASGLPLVSVHHIEGHICANYIEYPELQPPFLCLVASGGHSHLVLVKEDYGYEVIGQTRDDAAGEAFDKIARALGLGYPGGPLLDKAAKDGDPAAISLPRTRIPDAPYDFSFSGLKSHVLNHLNRARSMGEEIKTADVAASFKAAVVETLTEHTIEAAKAYGCDKIAIAGGVASNTALRARMEEECASNGFAFYRPSPLLCTDNAAMIGAAGYLAFMRGERATLNLNARPDLAMGERGRRYHVWEN